MVDYAALADTAKTLVDRYGRQVVFERYNQSLQDNSKPWKGPTSARTSPDAQETLSGVFIHPSSLVKMGLATEDSEILKRSSQVCLVGPGSTFTENLRTFNEVVDGQERWKIVAVETLKPGDIELLHIVGLQR